MSKAGVYKLTAPNGKCYVGQSINLVKRFRIYKGNHCSLQVHLHRAIKKYGWNNFTVEILWGTDDLTNIHEILDMLEVDFINLYDCIANGYNIREGGSNGAISKETKEKLSKARIKYLSDPKNMAKHRESLKNRDKTHITNLGNSWIKPVNQYDKQGNFIKTWEGGAPEVNRALKIAKSNICNVCNGIRKTAGGFIWEYNNNKLINE